VAIVDRYVRIFIEYDVLYLKTAGYVFYLFCRIEIVATRVFL